MQFKIHVRKNEIDEVWVYDNISNIVKDSNGVIMNPAFGQGTEKEPELVFTPNRNPYKLKRQVVCIELSLGLSCNFNCKYCSQGIFKNRAYNGKPGDITPFMCMIEEAGVDLTEDGHIDLWGGEPFVYWKTIQALVPALRQKWPSHKITAVTNGSLLDKEKIDFCKEYGLRLSLSDDGLNEYRTEEAVHSAKKNDAIFDYAARTLGNNFKVGTVASLGNANVIRQGEVLKKRIPNLKRVYTQNVVRCFNLVDGDIELSNAMYKMPDDDLIELHDSAYQELSGKRPIPEGNKPDDDFIQAIYFGQQSRAPAQCAMPIGDTLCVNLRGDIFSCHSWAALGHEIGHLHNYDQVHITGHTHWSKRKSCANCGVLALCHGDCSRISNEAHSISCPNRFARLFAVFRKHFAGIFGVYVMAIEPIEGEMMHANKLLNWRIPQDTKARKVIPIIAS